MQRIIIFLIFSLTLAVSAYAETRYITDQLLVALRPEQNDTAAPLELLPTGMRVEVVKDLGAFIKVRTATGTVGFARSKYFISTPPAAVASAEVQEQLTAALKQNAELTAELQQLKSTPSAVTNTELPQELEKSRNDLAELTKRYQELEQSRGDSSAIILERDELKKEVARLTETSKRSPLIAIQGGSQLQWFLAGAAILLVGWFAGKSTRSKRRF